MSRRGLVIDHFVQVFDATRRDLLHRFDHTRGYAYGETLCGLSSRLMWVRYLAAEGAPLPACPECELRWNPPPNSIACVDCQAVALDPPGGGLPYDWGFTMRSLGNGIGPEACYACPEHRDREPAPYEEPAAGVYRSSAQRQVINHRERFAGVVSAVLDCGHEIDQEDRPHLPRIGATVSCEDCYALSFPEKAR